MMTTTEKPTTSTTTHEDPFFDLQPGIITNDQYTALTQERPICRATTQGTTSDPDYVGQEPGAGSIWHCSRSNHSDSWRHIALLGNQVLGVWGGEEPQPESEQDPEPEASFTLETGGFYKFRNRPTLLMVVGFRRNNRVEVLDLTHERFRVLERQQLVPAREDMVPTPEAMKWAGKFMAERRAVARDTALRQRRAGYFKSLTDLNGILGELGLEPQIQVQQVQLEPRLNLEVSGSRSRSVMREEFITWLREQKLPEGWTWQTLPSAGSTYISSSDA